MMQMSSKTFALTVFVLVALLTLAAHLHGQVAVRNQGFVPYSDPPINYRTDPVTDPVAQLQERVNKGEVHLEFDQQHGYLQSVLDALKIPVSSQSLVFSKTSFQYRKISPKTPRALYFNDDVYVGFVQGGKALEFVSFDPKQGAIFYLLSQQKTEWPAFERAELDCTQCHVASGTRGVPGVLLRSIVTSPTGTQVPQTASFVTGHQSPMHERFGGWYVTGSLGSQTHMGVALSAESPAPFDTTPYLTPHSDIVAQLVQAHQTQTHNLITLTNYQTRLSRYADATSREFAQPAEELVRYLLFADETPLSEPVTGSSGFTREFAALGPRDAKGRSLRDFDLRTRLFKYPCSYLIYSDAFDALPEPAKSYVYRRLHDVLTGRDQSAAFAKLSAADRRAVLDILLATKRGLPDDWRSTSTTSKQRGVSE